MKNYILTYDIPRELANIKLIVNRDLHKISAKKVQHSLWKSEKLKELIDIAAFIKKSGGHAMILEEKLIF